VIPCIFIPVNPRSQVKRMRRPALYSSSSQPFQYQARAGTSLPAAPAPRRFSRLSFSSPRLLWPTLLVLAVLLIISLLPALRPLPRRLTQEDINAAVLKTLETTRLPSAVAKAYEVIRPSVVRVVGYGKSRDGKEEVAYDVGTGVVIVDKGIILTNLHVVQGAQSIKVVFSDGLESAASITGMQPENDLAVLQAHKIPDHAARAQLCAARRHQRPGARCAAAPPGAVLRSLVRRPEPGHRRCQNHGQSARPGPAART